MIWERDLLTELGLHFICSEHVIESDGGPLKGSTTPMVDFGTYVFKNLNIGNITPE